MTSRKKILSVLKQIKDESEINSDNNIVRFDLNHHVFGAGILNNDEEARILCKLRDEGFIEIPLPPDEDVVTSVTDEELIANQRSITISLTDNFHVKYFFYKLFTFSENPWNYVNPFWLVTQFLKTILYLVKWLWVKSKIITSVLGLTGSLLVYDWASARNTVGYLIESIKGYLGF